MMKHIAIIQGHPDTSSMRFCRAFASAYAESATLAGHVVIETIDVAKMDFPWLRTKDEFEKGVVPQSILAAQETIRRADHLLIVFPLWLGDMPALLKAFFEQTMRPGFSFGAGGGRGLPAKLLKGKSARVVITMGMPAFFYRFYFGAHGLKNLKRNILAFCGVAPVRHTLIGMIEGKDPKVRLKWLALARELGRKGV